MKDKIINLIKTRSTALVLCLMCLVAVSISMPDIRHNFITRCFYAEDMKSDILDKKEKHIDEEQANNYEGIFTYIPYESLEKGKYRITAYYKTDSSKNGIDVVNISDNESMQIGRAVLSPSKNMTSFDVELDDNEKVAYRTYYGGKGYLDIEKIEVDSIGETTYYSFLASGSFILLIIFGLIVFKKDFLIKYRYSSYIGLLYCLLSYKFTESLAASLAMFFICALLMTFRYITEKNGKWDGFKARMQWGKGNSPDVKEIICSILSAYMISSTVAVIKNFPEAVTDFTLMDNVNIADLIFDIVIFFHIIMAFRVTYMKERFVYAVFLFSSVWFGAELILNHETNMFLSIGVTAVLGFITYFVQKDDKLKTEDIKISYRTAFIILTVITLYISLHIGIQTMYRYKTFYNTNFDFGIFSQMYEYMAKTFMPLTTVERGVLMSHFYIHFSPILYTILPIYMIFRDPSCLNIIQSIIVGLAVYPVFMIVRHFKLPPLAAVLIPLLYILAPGIVSPQFYDFHENAFLPVLILWFIYFFLEKRYRLAFLFAFLTLMIKEDAAIYISVISLWFMAARKEYKAGAVYFLTAIIYFGIVMAFIQAHGYGLMETHYKVFYHKGEAGITDMIKNITLNPAVFINNIFREKTFTFIYYTIGSMLFIPLIPKNYKNLILFIPYLLIHLMTTYDYQTDLYAQYTYGTSAIMLFMFILNTKDLKKRHLYTATAISIIASSFLIYSYRGDKLFNYFGNRYEEDEKYLEEIEGVLKKLPEDSVVSATTHIMPHLYRLNYVYGFNKDNTDIDKNMDYYILENKECTNEIFENIKKAGYTEDYKNYYMTILKKA